MKLNMKYTLIVFLIYISYTEAIEFPWMYYLPYGNIVTLRPLFRNSSEKITITSCKWTTPKQIDFYPDNPTYDQLRYKIDKRTCELTIYNIQKDTNGIYHCTINDFYISKAMLNVHGAPKASLLEEYTPNLIAGFSTAGGCFIFLIIESMKFIIIKLYTFKV